MYIHMCLSVCVQRSLAPKRLHRFENETSRWLPKETSEGILQYQFAILNQNGGHQGRCHNCIRHVETKWRLSRTLLQLNPPYWNKMATAKHLTSQIFPFLEGVRRNGKQSHYQNTKKRSKIHEVVKAVKTVKEIIAVRKRLKLWRWKNCQNPPNC